MDNEYEAVKNMIDRDFSEGWNAMIGLASAGNEQAMEFVALSYYKGEGVEENNDLAYQWFNNIVRMYPNNGKIWNRIAECHFNGYGVERSHEDSIEYYTKAWENGIASAGSDLGWIYTFGDIPINDDVIGGEWFKKSADAGSVEGIYFTGVFYAEGRGGFPLNENIASEYFEKAIELGHIQAIEYMLSKNCYGSSEKMNLIRNKLFELAENGNSKAQLTLGLAYLYGKDDPDWDFSFDLSQDLIKSKYYLEMSAKQGNSKAAYHLGDCLTNPLSGFEQDIDSGERYLLQAADNGVEQAYYRLYRLYRDIKQDPEKASYWEKMSF